MGHAPQAAAPGTRPGRPRRLSAALRRGTRRVPPGADRDAARLKGSGGRVDMGGMSRISAERRELYGLGLGVLLLANLACGAAVVVARASGPDTTPASAPARPAAPAVVADHAAIPAAPSAD